mmetsp:Transcript_8640/g.28348  ORF Transcript_8640/g.28348 Transcript_8640/m.28348 type:complete len:246 (-) Transcript_8640:48-785(-)
MADVRIGVHRKTMETNVLLRKTELGSCKFTGATPSGTPHSGAFGLARIPDKEGAREVSMIWKPHVANPHDQPGDNFVAMDKLATMSGLTTAPEHRQFQQTNHIKLKTGRKQRHAPPLPSDKDQSYVYGRPSWQRPPEELRQTGEQPEMTALMQGAFHSDWVKMNQSRAEVFVSKSERIAPLPTKATMGVAQKAQAKIETFDPPSNQWKMKKFQSVPSRAYNHLPGGKPGTTTLLAAETGEVPAEC